MHRLCEPTWWDKVFSIPLKTLKFFFFLPTTPIGNDSTHQYMSFCIHRWSYTCTFLWQFICEHLMLQVIHLHHFLVLLMLSEVCYSFGLPSATMNCDTFLWNVTEWWFFVIWIAFMTLMELFYCSRGSTYFPVHADGRINACLRDFGHCWVCLDMAIICITTLSYMWILIDMIDGLSGLSYDPWYQKHGLYAHTVDREQIIPSYPPLPIPDITFYDQCISNDVNHILYCSWCCDKSLGITRAPRSSSWYVWP